MSRIGWLMVAATRGAARRARRRDVPAAAFAGLSVAVLVCGVTGGMLAVSLHPRAAVWVGFGLSVAVAVLCCATLALAALARRRLLGFSQVLLALVTTGALVSTAGAVETGTGRWVAFGTAIAYAVIALVILAVQAVARERVVHLVEVRELGRPRGG